MGTRYWNVPECLDASSATHERNSDVLFTRDHFCFGLLVYYMLFQKLPFSVEEDVDEERYREILELKQQNKVVEIVRLEMSRRWILEGEPSAVQEMDHETNFKKRHAVFRKLYESKAVSYFLHARKPSTYMVMSSYGNITGLERFGKSRILISNLCTSRCFSF